MEYWLLMRKQNKNEEGWKDKGNTRKEKEEKRRIGSRSRTSGGNTSRKTIAPQEEMKKTILPAVVGDADSGGDGDDGDGDDGSDGGEIGNKNKEEKQKKKTSKEPDLEEKCMSGGSGAKRT